MNTVPILLSRSYICGFTNETWFDCTNARKIDETISKLKYPQDAQRLGFYASLFDEKTLEAVIEFIVKTYSITVISFIVGERLFLHFQKAS